LSVEFLTNAAVYADENVQFFLVARQRLKTLTPTFVISSDPTHTSRSDSQCLGILRRVFYYTIISSVTIFIHVYVFNLLILLYFVTLWLIICRPIV